MADQLRVALRRWAAVPVIAQLAIVYLASRVVTTLLLWAAANMSTTASRFGEDATIGTFVTGWDAQWYWTIAFSGYPATLPITDSGVVAENPWAFMPVYPYLAQVVGLPFGQWGVGALLVSLAAGFGVVVMLHRLLEPRIGGSAAFWAATLCAFGPLAALFQVGYAEALFLFLLLWALVLIAERRFAGVYPIIVVAAFTRPGILAFALFLGLYGVYRWWRRTHDPLPVAHIVHVVGLGMVATVSGFSWQVIAGLATGRADAYLETELSWRRAWLGPDVTFVPFDGWIRAVQFWFGQWGLPSAVGIAALIALIVGFALLLWRGRAVRALGPEVRLWSASYALYLLAVFFPQSSTFRLLLPLTPLAGALAVPRSRIYRVCLLLACIGLQWAWIVPMYAWANTFWQVP